MYHFAKKNKPYTFMSIYDICRISFWRLTGLQCGHTTYTHTPHYIKIKWVYRMCPIKCYIKVISRHTK